MTGETEKGKSINVINRCLPRNSNFVMVQAARTPKTVPSGTQTAAVSSVRRMALSVSVSPSALT